MNDSKKLWEEVDSEITAPPIELGRYASDDYANDPKHFAFVTSRYKFASKLLGGLETVMEVGCGDGFGAPIVADAVERLICADINEPLLKDIERRHKSFVKNATYEYFDFREGAYSPAVNAVYLIDVIEHIFPDEEANFMKNLVSSIRDHGIMLIGTPNKSAEQYASPWSRKGHVNLKTQDTLRDVGLAYFHNVFMFGMNDEVVHTGYAPMCHFIWALCVDPRR